MVPHSPRLICDHSHRGLIGPPDLCLVLWTISIATSDPCSDLVTATAIDEPFQTQAHRLRTIGHDPSFNELINRSRKLIIYPGHQLSHASSIAVRIARCNANISPSSTS